MLTSHKPERSTSDDRNTAAILRKYHKYLAIINCVSPAQGVKDETRHARHIPVRLTCRTITLF
jgi:hypothetical protein